MRMLRTTDERIKLITEFIQSMRIVKMYCWESVLENKIRGVRMYVNSIKSFDRKYLIYYI